MQMNYRKTFLWTFYFVCVALPLIAIIRLANEYSLNKDLCQVKFKQFFEGEDDIVPDISMCFTNPFIDDHVIKNKFGVNSSTYLKFLKGEYFDIN